MLSSSDLSFSVGLTARLSVATASVVLGMDHFTAAFFTEILSMMSFLSWHFPFALEFSFSCASLQFFSYHWQPSWMLNKLGLSLALSLLRCLAILKTRQKITKSG